ncbi:MAG TPA: cobalamin-independent methionine synthase II family protein [Dehalococcoidia bacterium]|nr:cobalamin-independent methionine synthase II family protein [Dehalococcoidia bacterium]
MKRSTNRFLTTHMGSLERPDDLMAMLTAKDAGEPYDEAALRARVRSAVAEVVRQQAEAGIDIVNDGEFSKFSWASYFAERLSGVERRPGASNRAITDREARVFPEWFQLAGPGGSRGLLRLLAAQRRESPPPAVRSRRAYCVGPLKYAGQAEVQTDIENLKAAAEGVRFEELYLTALAPATAEFFMTNEYYKTDEEMLFAIAEAMREEYKAITDAGLLLQLDEPALVTMWQTFPDMTVEEYRRWMEVRVEAINVSLRGIPEDRVRMHVCWGSAHHPHSQDIPLADVVDIILKVNVGAYSLEAANPRHDGDWRVWKDVKLPEGKILIPGVIGHYTDFIESPALVADRFLKYADVVGKENLYGGTDCGIGTRVGHPSIGWAKFRSMAEGARLASQALWS